MTDPVEATQFLTQLGVGGGLAGIALWVSLQLYKDKEKATAEYHLSLIQLTREMVELMQQVKGGQDKANGLMSNMVHKVNDLEPMVERHTKTCIEHLVPHMDRLTEELRKKS